jgi:hypothetical protein
MSNERAALLLSTIALALAAAGFAFSVHLHLGSRAYAYSNDEVLRLSNIEGCERQNRLRRELNTVLRRFDVPPAFARVDCPAEYPAPSK